MSTGDFDLGFCGRAFIRSSLLRHPTQVHPLLGGPELPQRNRPDAECPEPSCPSGTELSVRNRVVFVPGYSPVTCENPAAAKLGCLTSTRFRTDNSVPDTPRHPRPPDTSGTKTNNQAHAHTLDR